MCEVEEMELAPLEARQYRRLWLDAEHNLGLVAETLAEATGWQPDAANPLPDALELADEAAARITMLQRLLATTRHRAGRGNPQGAAHHRIHA